MVTSCAFKCLSYNLFSNDTLMLLLLAFASLAVFFFEAYSLFSNSTSIFSFTSSPTVILFTLDECSSRWSSVVKADDNTLLVENDWVGYFFESWFELLHKKLSFMLIEPFLVPTLLLDSDMSGIELLKLKFITFSYVVGSLTILAWVRFLKPFLSVRFFFLLESKELTTWIN